MSENTINRNKINFTLIIIILLALVVRLIYLWQVSDYPNFTVPYAGLDVDLHHGLAKQVAGGDLLLGSDVYYYSSPIYSYFLGGLYALFGDSHWIAPLVNVALGTGCVALIYFFSLRFFQSAGIALIAATGAALYGPFLVFDTSGLKATAAQFVIALVLLLLSNTGTKYKHSRLFYIGLIMGVAYNLKGQMLIFIFGICIWLLFSDYIQHAERQNSHYWISLRKGAVRVCYLIIGFIIAVAPFTVRNYYVAKDPVLITSITGIHLYIGNHEGAWGGYSKVSGIRGNPAGHFYDAKKLAEKETGKSLSASQVSTFWSGRTLDFARNNPKEFMELLWKKFLFLLNSYEISNNENYQYLKNKSSFLALFPGFGFLMPLGLCGFFLALPDFKKLAPLYILLTSTTLAVVLTIVTWRYRLPLTLALLPFTGYFIVKTAEWIRERRYLSLLFSIILIACFWSISHVSLISEKRYNGEMKMAEMRMNVSKQENDILNKIASSPASSDYETSRLLVELSELRRYQFDVEGSIEILRRALALDPDQPRQWIVLSGMLRQIGKYEEAKEIIDYARTSRFWHNRKRRK